MRLKCTTLALAALVASALPAAAVTSNVKFACKNDYKTLCPAYKVGTPALRACMEANANNISPPCIQALLTSGEVDKKRVKR